MAITNYGELKAALDGQAKFTHRSDMTSILPTLIAMAEARISRDLEAQELVSSVTVTFDGTTRFTTLPATVRRLLDAQVQTSGGRKSVLPVTDAQMNSLYSTLVGSGDPENYCLRGRVVEIQPTPGDGTALEFSYLGGLTSFSADADTNDVLLKYPGVYVYATMIEVCIFTQGDERLPVFQAAYDTEVARINEEAEELRFSGGPLQIMSLGTSTP